MINYNEVIVEIKENGVILRHVEKPRVYYCVLSQYFVASLVQMRQEVGATVEQEQMAFYELYFLLYDSGTNTQEVNNALLYQLSNAFNLQSPQWKMLAVWSYWWRESKERFFYEENELDNVINNSELLKSMM